MKQQKCSLCHEIEKPIESKKCKTGYMPLEDESRDFFSKICRIKYEQETKYG